MDRRSFLQTSAAAAALPVLSALPRVSFAQQLPFNPVPGGWRTFEVTTRVEILKPAGVSRAWIPVPSVERNYQKLLGNSWSGNARRQTRQRRQVWRLDDRRRMEPGRKSAGGRGGEQVRHRATARSTSASATRAAARRGDGAASAPRPPSSFPPTASCATRRYEIIARQERRHRQGARHLRVGRRQHLPRAEGARLRRRRHQDAARDRATSAASAPTSTRSTSASPARSACPRATSTASAW